MDSSEEKLTIGIDLGTTSVKVVLVNRRTGTIVASETMPTKANIDVGDSKKSEQSVGKIFLAVNKLLEKFPSHLKQRVNYIGISGQMHGVVMWKSQPYQWQTNGLFTITDQITTNLITWQDKRCSEEFFKSLPDTGLADKICSGFGVPTLLWLQKNEPKTFQEGKHCSTIEDLLVAILTGCTDKVKIGDQNASGWGFYNAGERTWKDELLQQIGFPTQILPSIQSSESIAGTLQSSWSEIPAGCPVGIAAGDMLASVLSILYSKKNETTSSAIINISTSIQLAFVLPESFDINNIDERYKAVEYRPYFGGKFLAAGAGLNGGNCLAFLVETLNDWIKQLVGQNISEDKIWDVLLREGAQQKTSDLKVESTLRGERTLPSKTASIENITLGNMSLGHIMRATCSGIVENMENLLPQEMLRKYGINKIYTTGSGLIRNKVLQEEIEKRYKDFSIEMCDAGDAAYGAAVMATFVNL